MSVKSSVFSRHRAMRGTSFLAAAACLGLTALAQTSAHAQAKVGTPPTVVTVTPDTSAIQLAKNMGVPVAVAQQVLLVDADKSTWTAAQQKISSDFIYLARMAAGKPAVPGVPKIETVARPDASGFVNVVIQVAPDATQQKLITTPATTPTAPTPVAVIADVAPVITRSVNVKQGLLSDAIGAVGGTVTNFTGFEMVAKVPVLQIEALAERGDVVTIRPFLPPRHVGRMMGRSLTTGKTTKERSALVPYLRSPRKKRTPAEMRASIAAALTRAGIPIDTFSLSGLLLGAIDYNGTDTGTIGQGVAAHGVLAAYNAYGVSGGNSALGRRIRIGVQSDGDRYLAASQTALDLPASDTSTYGTGTASSVTVAVDDTYTTNGTTSTSKSLDGPSSNAGEGTAMMQIIHDMVPDAKIFFASGDYSESQFAKNILLLRYKYNCDIICDDLGYYDEPSFSDGTVAEAVNNVTANGAFYFSSAGNEGHASAYSSYDTTNGAPAGSTSGTWEGDFVDGGAVTTLGGKTVSGNLNLFASGTTYNTLQYPDYTNTATSGTTITYYGYAYLTWSDPASGSSNDYDVYCISPSGTYFSASTSTQSGTQLPYETCQFPAYTATTSNPNSITKLGYRLYVLKKTGASTRALHLTTYGTLFSNQPGMTYNTPGCTFGHNSTPDCFGVAATPATTDSGYYAQGPYPNAFSASNTSEYFSSDGPRTVFYTVTGGPSYPKATSPSGYTLPNSTPTYTPVNSVLTFASGGTVRQQPCITAADGVSSSASFTANSGLNPFYGTSAAAPHAASIAALVMSYYSNNIAATPGLTINGGLLSVADMHTVLQSSAIDIEASGYDVTTGYGIVMPAPAIAYLNGFLSSAPVATSASTTSETINWATLLPASTIVNYGTTTLLGSTLTGSAGVTSHSTTLSGLIPGTTYYYTITTGTASGSATYTTPTLATFTTTSTVPALVLKTITLSTTSGTTTVTITVANQGSASTDVRVTAAKLGNGNTTTILAKDLGAMGAGASQTFTLTFPAVASGRTVLTISMTDATGAVFNFTQRVTAP